MRAPLAPQEKTEVVPSQGLQDLLGPLVLLERALLVLIQLSQDPQGYEVKQGMDTQDPQVLDKPGFKDGTALQVQAEQPEQHRPYQAQQGWQERQDPLVTQLVRREP